MARYIAECDCYGYQGRYWRKGETAELPESEKPPRHFRRLDALAASAEIVKSGEDALSNDNDLAAMSVKELKALADVKGIEYPPVIKKAELIELIEKGSGE